MNNGNFIKNYEKKKINLASWHQTIFPKGNPFSIVAPSLFHNQVRDGLVSFQTSKDTRINPQRGPLSFVENLIEGSPFGEAVRVSLSI